MNTKTGRNFNEIDFKLSNRYVFDFKLVQHIEEVYHDFNDGLFLYISNDETSKLINSVVWSGVSSVNLNIPYYGLTAIDNGGVPLLNTIEDTLIESPLILTETDNKFEMFPVKGYKNPEISWDLSLNNSVINFNGGFYQGFYKLNGYNYQTLPDRHEKGYTIHTRIKRAITSVLPDTINELSTSMGYDNNGFFLYFGTRAENKFWNTFDGDNILNGITEKNYEGVVEKVYEKEGVESSAQDFIIPLNPPRVYVKKVDNQFLIYGRSNGYGMCGQKPKFGFGTKNADELIQGSSLFYMTTAKIKDLGELNPFLKYGRSSGSPICENPKNINDPHIDKILSDGTIVDYGTTIADNDTNPFDQSTELDVNADLIDNACGFRITDEGKIGYRRIVPNPDCGNNLKFIIEEKYSEKIALKHETWYDLTLVWKTTETLNDQNLVPRNGKLFIYIDGYLKDVFNDFREIIAKPLNDHKNKQLGVPYNISLGGGTLGLHQSITFNGPDPNDSGLLLEQNFCGTFIGSIDEFKMFDIPLNWCDLQNLTIKNISWNTYMEDDYVNDNYVE